MDLVIQQEIGEERGHFQTQSQRYLLSQHSINLCTV